MYVRKVRKPNGHISVRVVESYRAGNKVKQRTICCVGHCHAGNEEKIATLYKIGKNVIRDLEFEGQSELSGLSSSEGSKEVKEHKDFSGGGEFFMDEGMRGMVHAPSLREEFRLVMGFSDIFGKLYDELDLSSCFVSGYKRADVGDLFKEMVLHRVRCPLSKRGSVLEMRRWGQGDDVKLDRVYRMMDKVYDYGEELKGRVCDRTLSLFKERVDVVFFDVTTLYFESFNVDDLRSSGFSKDNKVKESQVVLALMTTEGGLPVGYELFPGRSYEGKTLIKSIDGLSKSYDIKNMFLVADRGMFSKENLGQLEKRGVQFIVGARLKKVKRALKDQILEEAPGFSKRGPFRRVRSWTKEYEREGLRLIVRYSRERAERDKKERDKMLAKIKEKMKGGRVQIKDLGLNRGIKKYLKFQKKEMAILDEEKLEKEKLWDGFSAVLTNDKKTPSKDIFLKYGNLWQIEAAFRLNKHDLKMRPIYHWTPKRIKAHILICFVAYGLAVFARHHLKLSNLNLSFQRIREELNDVQVSRVKDNLTGKKFLLPSKLNPTQKAIYKAFNKPFRQTIQFI